SSNLRRYISLVFCFSSRRRHTRFSRDWSSDVCSSDLVFQDKAKTLRVNEIPLLQQVVHSRSTYHGFLAFHASVQWIFWYFRWSFWIPSFLIFFNKSLNTSFF